MQDHISYNKKIFNLTIKDFKKEKKHKHARYDHIRDLIAILIASNKIKNIYDFGGNYLTFLDLKKKLYFKNKFSKKYIIHNPFLSKNEEKILKLNKIKFTRNFNVLDLTKMDLLMFNSVLHYIEDSNDFIKQYLNFFSNNVKFILITDTRFALKKKFSLLDKKHNHIIYYKRKNYLINILKKKFELLFESSLENTNQKYEFKNLLFASNKNYFKS